MPVLLSPNVLSVSNSAPISASQRLSVEIPSQQLASFRTFPARSIEAPPLATPVLTSLTVSNSAPISASQRLSVEIPSQQLASFRQQERRPPTCDPPLPSSISDRLFIQRFT
jgi:hypothetical protein